MTLNEENKVEDLISVIVPVYNVEKYLNKCIDSISKQSYSNIEIILVNDGSQDLCPQICEFWAKKDSRIKVIHKKNGGLSDARNAGLSVASGKYIGFVDGDDWIQEDMYENLYDNMHSTGSDISVCGVKMVWQDVEKTEMLTKAGSYVLDNVEAMQAIIEESWLKQPVWNRLYKKEIIEDIKFPVGKYHEDVYWSYQAIAKARIVSISDKVGYFYVQRANSIMGEKYSNKRLDAVEAKFQRLKYIEEFYPGLREITYLEFIFSCIYHGQCALRTLNRKEYNVILNYINTLLRQCKVLNYNYENILSKQKVWLKCTKASLWFTCKIRNCLKIGY